MQKRIATAVVAFTIGAAALTPATPASADAGAAVAAGIGGFALGALARPAPPPVYYGAPVYVEPVYERCWRERRPVFDEFGEVIGYRRQRVCE
jgi:hypothetical protein